VATCQSVASCQRPRASMRRKGNQSAPTTRTRARAPARSRSCRRGGGARSGRCGSGRRRALAVRDLGRAVERVAFRAGDEGLGRAERVSVGPWP
jgi:hypothetical protein